MWSRNSKWYWRESKSVLETFHVKWNFVMNVNCDCNKNICEAITITFPGKQTIMKHDMNKFNLTQSECRIQNLINLLVNRKKLNVFFLPLSFYMARLSGQYSNNLNIQYIHYIPLPYFLFPLCRYIFSLLYFSFSFYIF